MVTYCDSRLVGFWVEDCARISGHLRFTTPWLKPGDYRVDLSVGAVWTMDYWEGACSLMISPVLPYPNSTDPGAIALGMVFAEFAWDASEARRESAYNSFQGNENGGVPMGQSALQL